MILERRVAASPVWIRLRDTFTGAAPRGPVTVRLERELGAGWVPLEHPHRLGPNGDIALVNLGRTREPGAVAPFRVRVWASAPGTVPVAPNGAQPVTVTVTAWPPDAPNAPSAPVVLNLFPGPEYAFPPGTPVLAGRVTNHGAPIARAVVTSNGTASGTVPAETVRTGPDGRFRLPLRWSAGATDVRAAHGTSSGSITVDVPADLTTSHEIKTLP